MISVIVPVYNVEKYLRECLDSLIRQTYKDFEVIMIDDGSTDGSGEICEEYEKTDSRFVVIHEKNGGLSIARNQGLKHAKGELVYFLDSDDYIRDDALMQIQKAMSFSNADMCFFEAEVVFEKEDSNDFNALFYSRKTDYGLIKGNKAGMALLLNDDFQTAVPLHAYKKGFLEKNKLLFYPGILHEDNLFSPLAYVKAGMVSHIHQKLYYRRVRNGSIMTNGFNSKNFYGYNVCLFNLANEYFNISEKEDKEFLYEFIKNRCEMLFNFFIVKPYAQRKGMKNEYHKFVNTIKKFKFFNDKKFKAKTLHADLYASYRMIKVKK